MSGTGNRHKVSPRELFGTWTFRLSLSLSLHSFFGADVIGSKAGKRMSSFRKAFKDCDIGIEQALSLVILHDHILRQPERYVCRSISQTLHLLLSVSMSGGCFDVTSKRVQEVRKTGGAFTLHTSHFTLRTLHFIVQTSDFTVKTSYFTLHTSHFTVQTSRSILHTSHFTVTLHTSQFRLHS